MLLMSHPSTTRGTGPLDPTPPANLGPEEVQAWREILQLVRVKLIPFDGFQLEMAAHNLVMHRYYVGRFPIGSHPEAAGLIRSSAKSVLLLLHYLCIAPDDRRYLLTGKRH